MILTNAIIRWGASPQKKFVNTTCRQRSSEDTLMPPHPKRQKTQPTSVFTAYHSSYHLSTYPGNKTAPRICGHASRSVEISLVKQTPPPPVDKWVMSQGSSILVYAKQDDKNQEYGLGATAAPWHWHWIDNDKKGCCLFLDGDDIVFHLPWSHRELLLTVLRSSIKLGRDEEGVLLLRSFLSGTRCASSLSSPRVLLIISSLLRFSLDFMIVCISRQVYDMIWLQTLSRVCNYEKQAQ